MDQEQIIQNVFTEGLTEFDKRWPKNSIAHRDDIEQLLFWMRAQLKKRISKAHEHVSNDTSLRRPDRSPEATQADEGSTEIPDSSLRYHEKRAKSKARVLEAARREALGD